MLHNRQKLPKKKNMCKITALSRRIYNTLKFTHVIEYDYIPHNDTQTERYEQAVTSLPAWLPYTHTDYHQHETKEPNYRMRHKSVNTLYPTNGLLYAPGSQYIVVGAKAARNA